MLEENGIGDDRVQEVRGYADKRLRVRSNLLDPVNRRITILLPLVRPAATLPEGGIPTAAL